MDMVDDERLLADLGKAVRAAQEVPDRCLRAAKGAFTWRTIDTELAELSYDSVTRPTLAGVRAEAATVRALTFTTRGITIDVEITADALQGNVAPPCAGDIEMHLPDGTRHTASVDADGWFIFTLVPAGTFRLYLHCQDGTTMVSAWTLL
jgi:hypothetical protein